MSREADMALVEFCAVQFEDFDPSAWTEASGVPLGVLAAAASFLALAAPDWARHRRNLERVAETLAPGRDFPELARECRFDFLRFRSLLAARLLHACPLS